MGTNYYFFTKNKKIAHLFATKSEYSDNYYDEEYKIVEDPDLGYLIHLNKCSAGWKPLFQIHKPFQTFNQLRQFYVNYYGDLWIYDEYNNNWNWNDYVKMIENHSKITPKPYKWVYEVDELFPRTDGRPSLHLKQCAPDEADVFSPFDHIIYRQTEKQARDKFRAYNYYLSENTKYYNDSDYKIDWTVGEFS